MSIKDQIGEHHSVGEELLEGIPEEWFKYQAVKKALSAGYFTFEKGLALYKLTEEEYKKYESMEQNNGGTTLVAQRTRD